MKSLRSTQKLYRFKNALSEHLMEAQAAVNTIMIISLPKKTLSPKRPQKCLRSSPGGKIQAFPNI